MLVGSDEDDTPGPLRRKRMGSGGDEKPKPPMPAADSLEGVIARLSEIAEGDGGASELERISALREIARLRKLGETSFRKDIRHMTEGELQDVFFVTILPGLKPYIRTTEVRDGTAHFPSERVAKS